LRRRGGRRYSTISSRRLENSTRRGDSISRHGSYGTRPRAVASRSRRACHSRLDDDNQSQTFVANPRCEGGRGLRTADPLTPRRP
jgi:hypothetical protein